MTRPMILRAAILAAVLTTAPAAWAVDTHTFIKDAIQGNLAEIAVGKLAQKNASSQAVKDLGGLLVADHTKANQTATDVAKGMKVALPTAQNGDQTELYQRLAKEPAKQFDPDFINAMLQDHQKTIDAYEAAASDPGAVGRYAKDTLPDLQKHMAEIQKVARSLGI